MWEPLAIIIFTRHFSVITQSGTRHGARNRRLNTRSPDADCCLSRKVWDMGADKVSILLASCRRWCRGRKRASQRGWEARDQQTKEVTDSALISQYGDADCARGIDTLKIPPQVSIGWNGRVGYGASLRIHSLVASSKERGFESHFHHLFLAPHRSISTYANVRIEMLLPREHVAALAAVPFG